MGWWGCEMTTTSSSSPWLVPRCDWGWARGWGLRRAGQGHVCGRSTTLSSSSLPWATSPWGCAGVLCAWGGEWSRCGGGLTGWAPCLLPLLYILSSLPFSLPLSFSLVLLPYSYPRRYTEPIARLGVAVAVAWGNSGWWGGRTGDGAAVTWRCGQRVGVPRLARLWWWWWEVVVSGSGGGGGRSAPASWQWLC
jgi:hypothetical protein